MDMSMDHSTMEGHKSSWSAPEQPPECRSRGLAQHLVLAPLALALLAYTLSRRRVTGAYERKSLQDYPVKGSSAPPKLYRAAGWVSAGLFLLTSAFIAIRQRMPLSEEDCVYQPTVHAVFGWSLLFVIAGAVLVDFLRTCSTQVDEICDMVVSNAMTLADIAARIVLEFTVDATTWGTCWVQRATCGFTRHYVSAIGRCASYQGHYFSRSLAFTYLSRECGPCAAAFMKKPTRVAVSR
eukprot:scaffold2157_cov376-Prasinococcus_capsulatus_cf.AAC.2